MVDITLQRPSAVVFDRSLDDWLLAARRAFEREQLDIAVSDSFSRFSAAAMELGAAAKDPILDPSRVNGGELLAIFVFDSENKVIATGAGRHLGRLDLDRWMTDGRNWGEMGPVKAKRAPLHLMGGAFAYAGSVAV